MTGRKSLLRHAAEGFAVSLVGDTAYKVLGIATTFVVLALLTPYEYGLWRLLQSVLSFMSIIALSGIAGVVVADIARELGRGEKARAHAATWRASWILGIASVVAASALALAAPIITAVSKIDLTNYLLVLAFSMLFGGVTQVLQILFQAKLEPRRALILKNVGNLSYLIAIVLFIPYLNLSLMGLVLAYVVSVAVPVLVFLPYLMREFRNVASHREQGAYPLTEVLFRRGSFALATDYVTILESALWPWVVGYFLSIEQVAYAGLAVVIVSQVYSLIPLQYVLRGILPRMAEDDGRMQGWVLRASRYSLWMHLAVACGVLAVVALVMPMLFPAYAVVVPLVAALLIAAPFRAVGAVVTEWLYAKRNQRALFVSTALPRLALLVLLPALLSFFGMYGFVLWYLLSSISIIIVRFALAGPELRLPLSFRALMVPDERDRTLMRTALARATRLGS